MPPITEAAIDENLLQNIEASANDALKWLGLSENPLAEDVIRTIDEFIFRWQKGERPAIPQDTDVPLELGSLWGQQLKEQLGWSWASVTFRDFEDAQAIGVFSPDRSLAIYPFHFLYGCIENGAAVTVLLSYNLLVEGSRIPALPANGYENVMDNVHHIVPRE